MKKNTKLLLMLGVLALLIIIYFALPKEPKATGEPNDTETYYKVSDTDIENVTAISYEADGTVLSFKVTDGKWRLDKANAPEIDSSLISDMVSSISDAAASNKLEGVSAERLADYGLDAPSLKVTLTEGDKTVSYIFGDLNKMINEYYFAREGGTDTVFTVPVKVKAAFSYTLEELLIYDKLAAVPEGTITSIAFKKGDYETVITEVKTPSDDTEYTYSATLTKNGRTEDCSYADFERLASSVYEWNIDDFVCYAEDGGAEYGFDTLKTLTVNYTEKQAVNAEDSTDGYFYADRSVTVILGNVDTDGRYYCKVSESSPLVYKLSSDVFGEFFE